MRGLERALALSLPFAWAACASNHHVSEWGELGRPDLGFYVESPSVTEHLGEIDADTELAGLTLAIELRAKVGSDEIVLRSYEGTGVLGEKIHAIRAASPYGVILALGPIPSGDLHRREATELVPALAPGPSMAESAFRSLSDLTGSGALDVVAKDDGGRLAVYSLRPRGAVRVEVTMEVTPTEGDDVDGDGHVDLLGRVRLDRDDELRPDLYDVATFDGARFSNRTDTAKAAHARERDARDAQATPADPRAKLRAALERAWHAILAGDDRDAALEKLDQEKPPAELANVFAMHRRRISKISSSPKAPKPSAPKTPAPP